MGDNFNSSKLLLAYSLTQLLLATAKFQPPATANERRIADGSHQLLISWKHDQSIVQLLDEPSGVYKVLSLGALPVS